ncbi:MAG: GPR endopeptidase, partial [Faecalibacterium sp.]|nr:GPR endopeptidase [Faecalibacterium sp.]
MSREIVKTDLADELFGRLRTRPPAPTPGVRMVTARSRGVTVTRVLVSKEGLPRPKGRYVTLDTPALSLLDERDEHLIELAAAELRSLLPAEGPVLVIGVGNRRVTADALGPRTVQKVLVTTGPVADQWEAPLPGVRPVAAVAPGVSAATGIPLQTLAQALVAAVKPAAVLCVDSLCSAEPQRLGRTIQFSDTGLYPAQPGHAKNLTRQNLGVPVIAAGVPTIMAAKEGDELVVTPRALDQVIGQGAALLGAAINRALQPGFTVPQLC